MNLFGVLNISESALVAERERAEVVTTNLANADTTRTPQGGPYQRMEVVFSTEPMAGAGAAPAPGTMLSAADQSVRGVHVVNVVADGTPPIRRYEPGNPDANAQGYVLYPSINPAEEMADLMDAARAYQLNATAVQATKSMIQTSLDLLR
jgi:flagellar basal-body rod protein FlgC